MIDQTTTLYRRVFLGDWGKRKGGGVEGARNISYCLGFINQVHDNNTTLTLSPTKVALLLRIASASIGRIDCS